MGDHPLRPPTRRRLGEPLPRQQANGARGHPPAINVSAPSHAGGGRHPVSGPFSQDCSGLGGGFLTCYSPFRHFTRLRRGFLVRLACLIHAASVHSEPGSNSPYENIESLTAPCLRWRGRAFLVLLSQTVGGAVFRRHLTSVCRFVFYYALHRIAKCASTLGVARALRCPIFKEPFPHFLRKRGLSYHVSVFLQIDKSHFSEKCAFFLTKTYIWG